MQKIWTIKEVLDWTVDFFKRKAIPEPRLSAELLLSHILNCKRLDLYIQFERILTGNELEQYRFFVQRRGKGEPVQYITGEQEFMGLPFRVNPGVLIPRRETELLVETTLDVIKTMTLPISVLDVGTGSGAIALSLAYLAPDCQVDGIDISPAALETAKENAKLLNISNATFRLQDATVPENADREKYDLVVSNPPYVGTSQKELLDRQVSDFEPETALYAGEDGMDFYRKFIPQIPLLLKDGGTLLMEIGFHQKDQIFRLLETYNFVNIDFIKDYQNIDRIVKAKYEK